jgi:hypothetical protein
MSTAFEVSRMALFVEHTIIIVNGTKDPEQRQELGSVSADNDFYSFSDHL